MIHGPYTLFTRIPVYLGEDGRVFTDQLWCKDLELHLDYIKPFALCCPALPLAALPNDAVQVRGLEALQVMPLRQDQGWGSVLRNVLPNFRRVVAAVRRSRIVHSGGAGWAFPLSFYILVLSPIMRFRWVMVIESSFWMKPINRRPKPREWLSHHIHYVILRACLRRADARIFTQDAYRRFFDIGTERCLIAPAVWVDEGDVISDGALQARLALLPDDEIRLLFPARLVPDKGVGTVLEAVERAEAQLGKYPSVKFGRISLDIVGSGELAETCREFADRHRGKIQVRFMAPVLYGPPFLSLLGRYHAIILANRQQEQPRVIFDAFSQGVPVISSATAGVADIVSEGRDALLFDIDDSEGLARRILDFAAAPELRRKLALNALLAVRGRSHAEMHRARQRFLETAL